MGGAVHHRLGAAPHLHRGRPGSRRRRRGGRRHHVVQALSGVSGAVAGERRDRAAAHAGCPSPWRSGGIALRERWRCRRAATAGARRPGAQPSSSTRGHARRRSRPKPSAAACALAEVAGASIFIVHVSSAPALAAVVAARARGVDVRAETCPQYLYLDRSSLEGPEAPDFVCTPPLREPSHARALWDGLATGAIDTVATDHCPFTRADRRSGVAWAGQAARLTSLTSPAACPGSRHGSALLWQGVRDGRITTADWVRLCAEAPASIFGLWPTKGSLTAGADADVVVWDSGAPPVARGVRLAHGRRPLAIQWPRRHRLARAGAQPGPRGRRATASSRARKAGGATSPARRKLGSRPTDPRHSGRVVAGRRRYPSRP